MWRKAMFNILLGACLLTVIMAETCEDPNAYWSETDATICQNTCERPDLALYCKHSGPVAGCICNHGYLKNKEGKCELTEECAIKGTCEDPNAEFSLSMATGCQDTCRSPDTQSRCFPAGPQAGCVCNQGFVKNDRNQCVTIYDCEPLNCTGPYEVYDPCPPQCPTEFCDQAHLNGVCPYSYSEFGIRFVCIPACRCQKGFFRKRLEHYESVCVPRGECS